MPTFKTIVYKADDKNATGLQIPPEIIEGFGKSKKPPVKITINNYTYRSTVAVMGGVFMVGLSAENRAGAGVQGGDAIEVTIELDTEPRTVDIPEDLAAALAAKSGAQAAFDALAFSARKEHVRQVVDAKAEETRQRRIANIVAKLGDG